MEQRIKVFLTGIIFPLTILGILFALFGRMDISDMIPALYFSIALSIVFILAWMSAWEPTKAPSALSVAIIAFISGIVISTLLLLGVMMTIDDQGWATMLVLTFAIPLFVVLHLVLAGITYRKIRRLSTQEEVITYMKRNAWLLLVLSVAIPLVSLGTLILSPIW